MAMVPPASPTRAPRLVGFLLGLAMMAAPALSASVAQSRLVHCGRDTCLRISGRRSNPAVSIRIDGDALAVDGNRDWRVTVPLSTARIWARSSGSVLTLTSTDARGGTESRENVMLPPGAFGQRVELASLVVRAH